MRFETHSHSHYSNIRLIDSICKPKDLILTAFQLGYSGITITDHEALCGHVEWLELENDRACQITKTIGNGGYKSEKEELESICENLANNMEKFEKAFSKYIKDLKI